MNRIELLHLFLVLLVLLGITATARFTVTTEAESDHTALISELKEPSGIAEVGFADATDGSPLSLCVDDETAGVFILGHAPNGELTPRALLPFGGRAGEVDDLEAIAWDAASGSFLTFSSHRARRGRGDDTLVVRLRLDPDRWREPGYQPETEIDSEFTRRLAEWQNTEKIFRTPDGKAIVFWDQRRDNTSYYPYAFEIEGAAVVEGTIVLGVKYPLAWPAGEAPAFNADGSLPDAWLEEAGAWLIRYEPATGAFAAQSLPLGGFGISALAWDERSGRLLIAANRPEKAKEADSAALARYYGRSTIYLARPEGAQWRIDRRVEGDFSIPETRLEGIASIGDEIWLAYDGAGGSLRRIPRSAVFSE